MTTDIVGTIVLNPSDDRFLIYNIDPQTLPQNTLDPVDSIINPLVSGPNAGLPGPTPNKRYLIVESIGAEGESTVAWGGLVANANDIIQYDATASQWYVAFDSDATTEVEFVTNITTGVQYRYDTIQKMWVKSYEGFYEAGDFSIVI